MKGIRASLTELVYNSDSREGIALTEVRTKVTKGTRASVMKHVYNFASHERIASTKVRT